MSEPASQEPTMEEILASIRRIISEDEPGAAEPPPAEAAAPEPEPAPQAEPEPEPEPVAAAAPQPEPEPEEDVLELTEPVESGGFEAAAPAETIGDLDVFSPEPARSEPAPVMQRLEPDEPLVSGTAADAAVSAFSQLAQRIAMPSPNQTLDDVVRELLRPLLKDWLDRNLPAIVQAKVEEEVERLARRRLG